VSFSYSEGTNLYIFLVRDISEKRNLEQTIMKVSEDEKRALAHDLHDSICQELSGLGYMAYTVAEILHSESHSAAKQVERISEIIAQSMESLRRLSHSLDPLMEETDGLSAALRSLVSTTSDIFKMDCRFRQIGQVDFKNRDMAINLYRISQEAVHNAFRHGQASKVTITLKEKAECVLLKIVDNGSGLPTNESADKGIGLRIMKYRIGALGGWINIRNRPKGGVEVLCSAPKSRSNLKNNKR
jgi:two-component system, LuxR family, sensor kinase FixL